MTVNMWIATAAWLCLVIGWLGRASRKKHLSFVLSGIFVDVALVVYLQITRSAIQTAASFTLSGLEQTHILFSTAALLLYFPTILFGIRLLRGDTRPHIRLWHKRFALSSLSLRTLGFLFLFSMWKG